MKIVGLDLSYTATGIARVGEGTPRTACIKPPGPDKATWGERASIILRATEEWCEGADRVIIEGAAWNQIHAAYKLGKLSGVVEFRLHQLGIQYEYVPPSTIKKFATGSGKATKEQMVQAAQEVLPDLKDNNEADALFMALWGADKYA